ELIHLFQVAFVSGDANSILLKAFVNGLGPPSTLNQCDWLLFISESRSDCT
ncbi:hypothetical protein KEM48_013063, partial [Puccinia striiformis f. sp. tritici PST-130]